MFSRFVTRVELVPDWTGITNRQILGGVIHDLYGSADGSIAWWKRPDVQASAHYIVAKSGDIIGCVPEEYAAWHVRACDRWCPPWVPTNVWAPVSPVNAVSIGVEFELLPNDPPGGYTDIQLESGALLIHDINTRYNLDWGRWVRHGDIQLDRSDPRGLTVEQLQAIAERLVSQQTGGEHMDLTPDEIELITESRKIGLNSWKSVSDLVNREAYYRTELDEVSRRVYELEQGIWEIARQLKALVGEYE